MNFPVFIPLVICPVCTDRPGQSPPLCDGQQNGQEALPFFLSTIVFVHSIVHPLVPIITCLSTLSSQPWGTAHRLSLKNKNSTEK